MSAIGRVRRARVALLTTVAGAALLWAAVLAAGLVVVVALADLLTPLPLGARRLAVPAAIAAAAVAAALVLWRGRHARTLGRVALFLEERLPALQFTLATAIEPAGVPSPAEVAQLERAIARVEPRGALRRPVVQALGTPAAALAVGLLALLLLPGGTLERVLHPRAGDIILRPVARAPLGSRLSPIAVHVEPPRYARRAGSAVDDPASVAALVGSRIEVRGRGAAAEISDKIGAELGVDAGGPRQALRVEVDGDQWRAPVVMPAKPTAVRLTDRKYDRLLVLAPVPDEPPVVTLVSPAHDSVLANGKGTLALVAQAQDDIGLGRGEFELLYTSGGENAIQSKRWSVGRVTMGGARSTTIRATLSLDSLRLGPGDVLHVRAIFWDENDVTGPGKGESETRTLRVFDPRQKDIPNINPAKAAAIDTTIVSQRMLNMRAESLLVRQRKLPPEEFTTKSLQLGVKQGQLRGRVRSIVFELENVEGVGFVGETPVSKILKEAAVAMQDAETELSIAQVATALPHMRRALKLLEQVRDANRYWLRGLLTTKPIEVDKVRLTGMASATVGGRDARRKEDDARLALLDRFDRAYPLLERDPAAGRDSLRLILVTALTQAKDAAKPLSEAIEAMQGGRDARAALLRTRRSLERRTDAEGGLSGWGGIP